ncbi:MAG: endoribonuclease MazF [Alphaproteobacteria bacterium]|nr:endoribonuclease MazF [Alphaproteobacteria bacterium]
MVTSATPRPQSSGYVPERGDIVWLNFDPQSGHEQAGKRPALVVSPRAYNAKTSLALFCPVTSHVKRYPFEAALPAGSKIKGVVLSDQVKSLDWRARRAQFIAKAPHTVINEVLGKLRSLVG